MSSPGGTSLPQGWSPSLTVVSSALTGVVLPGRNQESRDGTPGGCWFHIPEFSWDNLQVQGTPRSTAPNSCSSFPICGTLAQTPGPREEVASSQHTSSSHTQAQRENSCSEPLSCMVISCPHHKGLPPYTAGHRPQEGLASCQQVWGCRGDPQPYQCHPRGQQQRSSEGHQGPLLPI